jgi:hypothetical protein
VAAANVSGDPSADQWREVLSSVVFNSNATQLNCLDELGQRFMAMGLVYPAHVWCVHFLRANIDSGMVLTLAASSFLQARLSETSRQQHTTSTLFSHRTPETRTPLSLPRLQSMRGASSRCRKARRCRSPVCPNCCLTSCNERGVLPSSVSETRLSGEFFCISHGGQGHALISDSATVTPSRLGPSWARTALRSSPAILWRVSRTCSSVLQVPRPSVRPSRWWAANPLRNRVSTSSARGSKVD